MCEHWMCGACWYPRAILRADVTILGVEVPLSCSCLCSSMSGSVRRCREGATVTGTWGGRRVMWW